MEKVVDPDPLSSGPGSGADVVNSGAGVVDPLSGPGAGVVESGHSQAVQPPAASEVDLKFLAGGPGFVVVVVVGGTASVVVVSTPVGALPVVVGSPSAVVVSSPVVVASGVVPADVVASGVVPQQTMISSAEQVGRVVAATLDVVAAALMVEATQVAAKRTTATFIFSSAFSLSLSLGICMQRLWVLSVFSLLLGAAYQKGGWGVTWARQGGFIHPVNPLSSSFVSSQ